SLHALCAWASRPCLRSAMTSMQLDASGRRHPSRPASSERGDARAPDPWSARRSATAGAAMTEAPRPPAREDEPTVSPFVPRAHHLLQLEFGDRQDFDDPRLEWRRLFSELLGTFALVLVAAGGGLLHGKGQITLAPAVVAP